MNQLALFDSPPRTNRAPIAAAADPATSHLAAAELTRSGKRDSRKRHVLAVLRTYHTPPTSAELAHDHNIDRHEVARRLPDLAADGQVERCEARACGVTGNKAICWRAT